MLLPRRQALKMQMGCKVSFISKILFYQHRRLLFTSTVCHCNLSACGCTVDRVRLFDLRSLSNQRTSQTLVSSGKRHARQNSERPL